MDDHFNPDLITWVMPVPSAWGLGATCGIRQAAFDAGLTLSLDSDKLVVYAGAIAAAVSYFCDDWIGFSAGDCVLVIDAGGSKTDLSTHVMKVVENRLGLGEALQCAGIMVGGKHLDQVGICFHV